MDKRELITIFSQNFYVSQCRKISKRNPSDLCFRKFLVAKKFMDKRELITIFSRNFHVSQCRKISKRNPSDLCFRKCPVAKKFMDKRGGGEYQDFPSNIFCLTVPKNFIGEPFCAVFQKISGSEKVYG